MPNVPSGFGGSQPVRPLLSAILLDMQTANHRRPSLNEHGHRVVSEMLRIKWYYWALIAVVGLALYTYGVQGVTSKLKDKAYDARQAAGTEERKREDEKHTEAVTRAEAAEKRAAAFQAKINEQQLVIAIAGDNAEKALKRIKDEDQKFIEEAAKVGRDIPAAERCLNICERLQRLRLITAAEAADCRADCQR